MAFDLPMAVGAIAMSVSRIVVAANAQLLRGLSLCASPCPSKRHPSLCSPASRAVLERKQGPTRAWVRPSEPLALLEAGASSPDGIGASLAFERQSTVNAMPLDRRRSLHDLMALLALEDAGGEPFAG